MTRRTLVIASAAVAAVLVFAMFQAGKGTDEPSGSYCSLYPKIDEMVTMLERGLDGRAEPGDLPVSNYQNLKSVVWSDKVAEGGPASTDDRTLLIASAVRTAATDEDPAPLQTVEVREAVDSVGPEAAEACEGFDG